MIRIVSRTLFQCYLALLLIASASGQEKSALFSFTPSQIEVGHTITVKYDPTTPGAQLKDMSEVYVDVLIYRKHIYEEDNQAARVDAPLKKDGDQWVGTLSIDDPDAKYILFRIISGDRKDDNGGKCWDALVFDDGKPVQGAYMMCGGYYAGWGYYYITRPKDVKDSAKAKENLQHELEIYPDNHLAELDLWNLVYGGTNTDVSAAKAGLDRLHEKYKGNDLALLRLYHGYNTIGDSSRALEIRKEAFEHDSRGLVERRLRWGEIFSPGIDQSKKVAMEEQYLKDFPNLDKLERQNRSRTFFNDLLTAKEYDKAYGVLHNGDLKTASYYNELAWGLIEKGEQLEKATEWAKKGVELARNPDPSTRQISMTKRAWEEGKGATLGMVLDTYGYGLFQLGKFPEAEENYRDAYKLLRGDDMDVNRRYIECLVKNEKYDEAIATGSDCVRRMKNNPRIVELVKESVVKLSGSSEAYDALSTDKKKQFESLLAEATTAQAVEARKKVIESRISKPSIDFTLNSMEGTPVTLSLLKGKVVVLDFWATWCGPCKASFPFLQKVYDKYKNNGQVLFLAVDTWERVKGYPATVENAKKFIADNKYTFPVVFDEVSGKRVAELYEVEGIPTKFLIDKKGNIAFKSVGFGGPEMEGELIQQIEILLNDSMGSLK